MHIPYFVLRIAYFVLHIPYCVLRIASGLAYAVWGMGYDVFHMGCYVVLFVIFRRAFDKVHESDLSLSAGVLLNS